MATKFTEFKSLDYFLWGISKIWFMVGYPEKIVESHPTIRNATISADMVANATSQTARRIVKCITQRGGHFEQLIYIEILISSTFLFQNKILSLYKITGCLILLV